MPLRDHVGLARGLAEQFGTEIVTCPNPDCPCRRGIGMGPGRGMGSIQGCDHPDCPFRQAEPAVDEAEKPLKRYKKSGKKKDISRNIAHFRRYGYPAKQAVAIAHAVQRRYKGKKK